MNAATDGKRTLEEVSRHVEQWRSGKKRGSASRVGSERRRSPWWETYAISRVSRTLRLIYTAIDKRRRRIVAAQPRQRGTSPGNVRGVRSPHRGRVPSMSSCDCDRR
jgi:hypothetical protein